ncbi:YhcN/YlaJ family sporulation lipoprotein [Aciduricibacillus chroicocephali]|uniref:YhcN/YlaJ family sporulation lipoprotein n=1 Tax=Aciduricibacillus chroicocephali TaxID=3054939 RepID=A0ABY9KXQ3_9BACI|nr:YhcN/YlaJ family sporulation lipoprotein [Bacillaceae bacterium 44XB]
MKLKVMSALLLFSLILLTACGNGATKADLRNSAPDKPDQTISIKAKGKLSGYKEIKTVHAINSSDTLFVAFDVHHHHSFTVEQIKNQARKDLTKMFPGRKIEISSDTKLVTETAKAEQELRKSGSNIDIKQKIEWLTKLSRKKT